MKKIKKNMVKEDVSGLEVLPEIYLTWPHSWVVIKVCWVRDTLFIIIVHVTAMPGIIVNPIDVVVHPVERHCRNLCVIALFLPIKDLSSQRLCRTIPDAGAD